MHKIPAHEAARWMRQNVSERRVHVTKTHQSVFFSPNMAELRRWLHDKTIPVGIRNHVYEWMRYRQARVLVRCHGVEHPSAIAKRRAYRRQDRIEQRKIARALATVRVDVDTPATGTIGSLLHKIGLQ